MIVGTAGHIDHGKTALVRALTGVDTDRLPEEKKRGISIELGYAYLEAEGVDEPIGFVDMPGHERFVATMLAGATGIDHALLLVAADDGVMPQTREHLAALALLGVGQATIVVTKVDRASDERIAEVAAQARALVATTPLAGAPLIFASAISGIGVEVLRRRLGDAAKAIYAARAADLGARLDDASSAGAPGFRLAVDRVFTLAGIGTVVTGAAHGGAVNVGDTLALVPSASETLVRVRSIHAQGRAVAGARAGQRVAIGLAGIEREQAGRGQWLADPAIALRADRIDARIVLWPEEAAALRSGTLVHVHHGTSDVLAMVAVLESAPIAPGTSGRVQLVLRAPIAAWRGDRLVLRDAAASRVLAGGAVLDPMAPTRYRRTPERLASLDAFALAGSQARLAAALEAAPHGLDLAAWSRAEGRAPTMRSDASALPACTLQAEGAGAQAALASRHAGAARARLLAALASWHAQHPDDAGPDAGHLRRQAAPRMAPPLWRALLDAAVAEGAIGRRAGRHYLPQHEAQLSAMQQRLVQKAWPHLLAGGFDPPWVRTLAADLHEPEALLRAALARAAQRGELHEVVRDLFCPPPTLARAATMVRAIAARDGAVSAAAFRDASGLGRKRAIQIVEYFDRAGLLRRVGDVHRLRADCDVFGERAAS